MSTQTRPPVRVSRSGNSDGSHDWTPAEVMTRTSMSASWLSGSGYLRTSTFRPRPGQAARPSPAGVAHCEDGPPVGHALEFVNAAVAEHDRDPSTSGGITPDTRT